MTVRQDTIICDLDGTLCNIEHRLHHVQRQGDGKLQRKPDWDAFFKAIPEDTLNESVWATINALSRNGACNGGPPGGFKIIFCSGRPERTREDTEDWLSSAADFNHFDFEDLYMRKDGDRRSDAIVKQEILDAHIDKERVLFVLDDRQCVVDMWRENGLTCFQVDPGNF